MNSRRDQAQQVFTRAVAVEMAEAAKAAPVKGNRVDAFRQTIPRRRDSRRQR